jgi:hypothetical protein
MIYIITLVDKVFILKEKLNTLDECTLLGALEEYLGGSVLELVTLAFISWQNDLSHV